MKRLAILVFLLPCLCIAEPAQQLLCGIRSDLPAAKKLTIKSKLESMGLSVSYVTTTKDGQEWMIACYWYAQVLESLDADKIQQIIDQVADSNRFLLVLTTDAAGELQQRGFQP